MSNIISSDFYRVRRGAALRNTCIGLLAVVVLVMVLMLVSQSDSYADMVQAGSAGMSAADAAEMQQDLADAQSESADIHSGADFGFAMLAQFMTPFFFLPIVIAVFCADFSASTYRNTLSFESNRSKVYMGKLVLSAALCLAMTLGMLVVSWLLGSTAFGFAGFSAAYFLRICIILLLQLPICLAFVAVCHFLVAITKKSSATIAIFLVGYIALAVAMQTLSMLSPSLEWLMLLEPQSSGRIMANYELAGTGSILFILGYNIIITAAATGLGLAAYRKSDMP